MSLAAGDRLGPYEILAPIGKGGMGEVYRARDPRVGRDVAIKVASEKFGERFEREAHAIASLNHPNICQLYDVGENYLVMELVEGETLKGPVPLETALSYARQIADALEAAHEKGVVHRDLKPANIKITPHGAVKMLDFGLAKMALPKTGDAANESTLTLGETQSGVILGTAPYMSPEQAQGKPLDKRTDIWAFGVVLYEMLTGRRLFQGDTVGETLAAVLTREPDWERIPAQVQPLLRRCLIRDPRQRLRDAGDAMALILETAPALTVSMPSRSGRLARWGWIAAALFAAAAIAGWWMASRATRVVQGSLMRWSIDLGPDAAAGPGLNVAMSPDGKRMVYLVRGTDGTPRLATRLLDQVNGTILPGTENAVYAFFSPNSQTVGFFADGKLKKISVQGGAPIILSDAPSATGELSRSGASWGQDGAIVGALVDGRALAQVSDGGGGTPRPLTKQEPGELLHRWPQILPGGQILFTGSATVLSLQDANIRVFSPRTGATQTLVKGAYFGRYLPTQGSTGHLVFIRDGVLYGAPLDPERLEPPGTAVPLVEDIAGDLTAWAGAFDFSAAPAGSGSLVYRSGKAMDQRWPVAWLDSSGTTRPLLSKPGMYATPRFSPDGQRLVLSVQTGKGRDISVYDVSRENLSQLTFSSQANFYPIWSRDQKHIAFRSPTASGGSAIAWIRSDGGGGIQSLLEDKNLTLPYSFSPGDKRLAYTQVSDSTKDDIWTLPIDMSDPEHPKPGTAEPFLRTPANERFPAFSPDGRWMAYTSDESDQEEIYVRPFLGSGGRTQISTTGGRFPMWSENGRELFFATPDNRIMVVEYAVRNDVFLAEKARMWSPTQIRSAGGPANLALHPDGKRFAVFPMPEAASEKDSGRVTLLLNFFDEVRRRIPAGK